MTKYSETHEDSLQMDVLNDIAGGMPWLMLVARPTADGQIDLEMRVSSTLSDPTLIRQLLMKTLAALPYSPPDSDDFEEDEDEFYD